MSIDSNVVPEIKIAHPDGKLLYLDLLTGEMTSIDSRVDVQSELSYSDVVHDSLYPSMYDAKEKADIDEYGTVQITHEYSKVNWDGVPDSLQPCSNGNYPGFVYDRSYPPTYNISDGILYVNQGPDVIDSAAEQQWKAVEGVYINDIVNLPDTSTESSDLKNTKSNIRKIKPDINSELKIV